MKTKKMSHMLVSFGILLTATFILSGCASKKTIWGSLKKGLDLTYRMEQGKTYDYQITGDVTQKITVNGQSFDILMKSYEAMKLSSTSPDVNPIKLDATIDSLWVNVKTPMKTMDADVAKAINKTIQISYSNRGIPLRLEQAATLTYSLGPEDRNLSPDFQSLLPKLPEKLVLSGDSWNYSDTLTENQEANWLQLIGSNVATLEGFETIGIKECARITVEVKGQINGKGEMQGIKTSTTGTYSGTDTYWFDYQQGVLVKMISEGTANTTTKTSGEREMTIPASRNYRKVTTLVH